MTANQQPSTDLLEDLCTRFILNVPAEELESFERLLFLVEQAHWFYEDFSREKDLTLRSYSLKEFVSLIFRQVPGLQPYHHQLEEIYGRFNAYKQTIPTMGAIILEPNTEKCLLVKGYRAADGWGFPTGKINRDEADDGCAVREVLEETGFDMSSRLKSNDYIEIHMQEKRCRLYIIQGVEESTPFAPLVRKEIGGFAWHLISELPSTKEQAAMVYHDKTSGARHRFFRVYPYMKQLRRWIKNKRKEATKGKPSGSSKLPGTDKQMLQQHQQQQHQQQQQTMAQIPGISESAGEAKTQLANPQQDGNAQLGLEQRTTAGSIPRPAPVAHCSVSEQPGQAWLNFTLDRRRIMQHLVFPEASVPVTAV